MEFWPLTTSSSRAVRTGLLRKKMGHDDLFVRFWPPHYTCACVCRRWPLVARVTALGHAVAVERSAFALGLELGTRALGSLALSARTAAACQQR